MLFLLFAGITVFPAYASDKGATTKTQHQSGKLASHSWKVISSPNVGAANLLAAVTTISATDIWAVGNYRNSPGIYQTLIEHWNGSNWRVVSSPNVDVRSSLIAMAAVSANDIWAVGSYSKSANGVLQDQTFTEHWNGSSWRVVSSPNTGGTSDDYLTGVTAISASDVWAVGYSYNKGIFLTLTEHWNGSNWRIVSSPSIGTLFSQLEGVVAISASDVWAVGYYGKDINKATIDQTLIEHWDGTTWNIVSSPNIGTNDNILYSVAFDSANDVWAVGTYANNTGSFQTLTEHWNGSNWSVVPSPHSGVLFSIAIVSANDIWAVGDYGINPNDYHTLTEHWNGTTWSVVSSPNVRLSDFLEGVTAVSVNNIWAVGYDGTVDNSQTLIEHYS